MNFFYYLPNILFKVNTTLFYKLKNTLKSFCYITISVILAKPFFLTRVNLSDS
jgi:hypothetical protein